MVVYISILLLVMIITAAGDGFATEKEVCLGTANQKRKIATPFIIFLVCAIFIFFFAARWNVGTDFPNYYSRFYKLLKMDFSELIGGTDWGFYTLSAFIGKFLTKNFFVYSLIIAAIIYIPLVLTYRKYTSNFTMTCAMYIMMCLYTWPFNGTRQSIAVTIVFAAYPLLYEKKNWWKYAVFVLLAYTFHTSALLVLPFILLTRLKPWKKPFVFSCLLIALLIILLPGLWSTVIEFLENMGQSKLASDYSEFDELRSGVNPMRILVAAIPVVLSYFYYDRLKKHNAHIDFMINMAVLNLLFLLCGYQLTVLVRFNAYFNLALPLLIPEFINIFTDSSKKLASLLFYGLYFFHMLLLLPNDSGLIPYNFIFGKI